MSDSERGRQPVGDDTAGFGSWRHRARYRFDNLLARGTWATLLWLGAITLSAILVSSLVLTVAGVTFTGGEGDWLEDAWQSLLRVIDPGTMAGDVGWGQRLLALAVTLFGILVAGTLIGIIASGVEDRIERMRRGRSVVIESDHVVVLGASDQLPLLVEQLLRARHGGGRPRVVVLAPDDPSELAAHIHARSRGRRDRVVVRSGDPTRQEDLALVRLSTVSGVVVLHEDDGGDTRVAETVLAVARASGGTPRFPVVAEVDEPATAARLVAACGAWVHPLVTGEALARSAAFALREPGSGRVLTALLEPSTCELHVRPAEGLAGTPFGDLLWHWANARPLGLVGPDGAVVLNPSDDVLVGPHDRVALLSRAEDLVPDQGSSRRPVPAGGAQPPGPDRARETVLVVGWSAFGARLLGELARWAPPGSSVEVVLDDHDDVADGVAIAGEGDLAVTRTASLPRLLDERRGLGGVTTVLLLASDRISAVEADVDTLLDLGVVQRARGSMDPDNPRVVVQVRDLDHAGLVELDGRHDWLISPGLASQMLAQLVGEPARRDVLLALYDQSATSSLALVPAEVLGLVGRVVVGEVVAAARSRGFLAIGHLQVAGSASELTLAPHLGATVDLAPNDRIVVMT